MQHVDLKEFYISPYQHHLVIFSTLKNQEVSYSLWRFAWVRDERERACTNAGIERAILDETIEYPAQDITKYSGYSALEALKYTRGENPVIDVARSCTDEEGVERCEDAKYEYLEGLTWYATPIMIGIFFVTVWSILCCMSCCRSLRRCCLCSERKEPRGATRIQLFMIFALYTIAVGAVFLCAIFTYTESINLNAGVKSAICYVLMVIDDTVNGSPQDPNFIGLEPALIKVEQLRMLLNVDSAVMASMNAILFESANFAIAMQDVIKRIEHMHDTLLKNHVKVKEHKCMFCELALGTTNSTTNIGLLPTLREELQNSVADAMFFIRSVCEEHLTGTYLMDTTVSLKSASLALEVFMDVMEKVAMETIANNKGLVEGMEATRHTAFIILAFVSFLTTAVLGTIAIWFARNTKSLAPSPLPSCATWCVAMFYAVFSFMVAGTTMVISVPVVEVCDFWRTEVMTPNGYADYYRELGLRLRSDPAERSELAVSIGERCFTRNGTGNLLDGIELEERFIFETELDKGFMMLEDKASNKVVDTAKFDILLARAKTFGGLFVLEPDERQPLDPNAAERLIGSSVFPTDSEDPLGENIISGLNSYAALIAGEGVYTFASGTSAGIKIITPTQPTVVELSSLPLQERNALIYARLKEELLHEPGIFYCDILDTRFRIIEQTCDYQTFKKTVVTWAEDIKTAGDRLGELAETSKQLIYTDLRETLAVITNQVTDMRDHLKCRFLWVRFEDFDRAVCSDVAPVLLQTGVSWIALGSFGILTAIMHYKIWRHFLDNRIIGQEIAKVTKKMEALRKPKSQSQLALGDAPPSKPGEIPSIMDAGQRDTAFNVSNTM